jgi:hypothetical protein
VCCLPEYLQVVWQPICCIVVVCNSSSWQQLTAVMNLYTTIALQHCTATTEKYLSSAMHKPIIRNYCRGNLHMQCLLPTQHTLLLLPSRLLLTCVAHILSTCQALLYWHHRRQPSHAVHSTDNTRTTTDTIITTANNALY